MSSKPEGWWATIADVTAFLLTAEWRDTPRGLEFTLWASSASRRLDWAALHQHTFSIDVLRCPSCGGRRRVIAVHSTRTAAEARLSQPGHPLPPRRLPPATAQPSLPLAG